jgi:hypothetical protein
MLALRDRDDRQLVQISLTQEMDKVREEQTHHTHAGTRVMEEEEDPGDVIVIS